MKPAPFDYCRPATVTEAVEALRSAESGRVLAGGQSLIPAMNFRLTDVSVLVDIGRVAGLDRVDTDGTGVTVGAAATQSRVLDDDAAARAVPGLRVALRHMGHMQIRNRGTVCGSIAHADPAAELPALAVATGAVIGIAGPGGRRMMTAPDFFLGSFWTALEEAEILTEVRFPAAPAGSVTVVDEICRRAGDFAVAGLVAVIDVDGGAVRSARLVGFGVGGVPIRLASAEAAISGWAPDHPDGALMEAAVHDTAGAFDDIHATAWYRREAVATLLVRAVRRALANGRLHDDPRAGLGGRRRGDGQRSFPPAPRPGPAGAVGLHPRHAGPHGHPPRLRARLLRRLHRDRRRRRRAVVPDAGRAGRRQRDPHRRGPRPRRLRLPVADAAGLPRQPRPAVRLLHRGVPDDPRER
ncbi:MAG: FAD binding domain-containing protein [Acidimicrobiia bacterium]|nr:FAD binding domain-containing protein [Acidimicrobiia bacterium]